MHAYPLSGLLLGSCVAAHYAGLQPRQDGTPTATAPTTVETGINTECKTCPYSLCPNTAAYESSDGVTLACWTEGDNIVETDVWYKTTDQCYVTEWDIVDGNYTEILPYCGEVAETYSQGSTRTVYNTECNIVPSFPGEYPDHTKMYKPDVPLTLTCRTIEGSEVLGNPVWYKTVSNCYVPEAQIEFVDDDVLDNCGPIPFMEAKMRQPSVVESESAMGFVARDLARNDKRWLYLTQIGEDFADCLQEADSTTSKVDAFPFGAYITVQCATRSLNAADDAQIYLLTTDFCWVNDTLTDPQLVDDELRAERYPNCDNFVDTET